MFTDFSDHCWQTYNGNIVIAVHDYEKGNFLEYIHVYTHIQRIRCTAWTWHCFYTTLSVMTPLKITYNLIMWRYRTLFFLYICVYRHMWNFIWLCNITLFLNYGICFTCSWWLMLICFTYLVLAHSSLWKARFCQWFSGVMKWKDLAVCIWCVCEGFHRWFTALVTISYFLFSFPGLTPLFFETWSFLRKILILWLNRKELTPKSKSSKSISVSFQTVLCSSCQLLCRAALAARLNQTQVKSVKNNASSLPGCSQFCYTRREKTAEMKSWLHLKFVGNLPLNGARPKFYPTVLAELQ